MNKDDVFAALDRLENDALASRDGYGDARKDAEIIRAALTAQPAESGEPIAGAYYWVKLPDIKEWVIAQRDYHDEGWNLFMDGFRKNVLQVGNRIEYGVSQPKQPDVNAELLDDTGLFCIINILEKAKVCAQNIIYDLPMGHNSGQQAIYARNYIHKAIYALQTATMQESVNAELLGALKYAHSMMQPFCDDTIVKQAISRAEQKGGE